MNTPLVSVIVPCYKVEKYIHKCVDSIISQTYKNLEIWLIDDGSPDNCGKICDDYAKKDQRIIVIHKPNGGLSDARNVAIEKATGEYITFVDSDDWLSNDAIEVMVSTMYASEAEIVVSNFNFVSEKNNDSRIAFRMKKQIASYTSKESLIDLFYQRNMETGAWGKLYNSGLWKDLRFPVGRIFEDIPTIYKTFFRAKKIVVISSSLYNYLLRDTSIMGESFNPKKMDAIYCSKAMLDDVLSISHDNDICKAARCRYVSMCFNTIFQTSPCSPEESHIWNEIITNRFLVLKDLCARKKTTIALLLSFFGTKFLRLLYRKKR